MVRARLSGRLVTLVTCEFLANFETKSSQFWPIANSCSGSCLTESVGEYIAVLAQDLGAVLAEQLDYIVSQPDYAYQYLINFNGVEEPEQSKLLKVLQTLDSYRGVTRTEKGLIFRSKAPRDYIARQLTTAVSTWDKPAKIPLQGNAFNLVVKYTDEGNSKKAPPDVNSF